MEISQLIAPGRVAANIDAKSKKRALEVLSEMCAKSQDDLSQADIFASMVGRERLGSTGVGHGVAIPHGRIGELAGSIGAFIRLSDPVDYGAADGQPVDMLFALLVPTQCDEQHLRLLALLAESFNDTDFCAELRTSPNSRALYDLLCRGPQGRRETA